MNEYNSALYNIFPYDMKKYFFKAVLESVSLFGMPLPFWNLFPIFPPKPPMKLPHDKPLNINIRSYDLQETGPCGGAINMKLRGSVLTL